MQLQLLVGVLIVILVVWLIAYMSSAKKKEIREDALKNVLESRKNHEDSATEEEKMDSSEKPITEEVVFDPNEVKEDELVKEEVDKEKQDAKFVYYFLNNLVKKMFYHYRTNTWQELKSIEIAKEMKNCDLESVKQSLPEEDREFLNEIMDCMVLRENEYTIINSQQLKEVFCKMVLPFYPSYYHVFGSEMRHTTFLNKNTLSLFHSLSGKKFRVGYKNRYSNGVTAFEWKGERYKVYRKDGSLVCDAVFKDGKIYDGFALEVAEDLSLEEWTVERTGSWKKGVCQEDSLHYFYKKPCK